MADIDMDKYLRCGFCNFWRDCIHAALGTSIKGTCYVEPAVTHRCADDPSCRHWRPNKDTIPEDDFKVLVQALMGGGGGRVVVPKPTGRIVG